MMLLEETGGACEQEEPQPAITYERRRIYEKRLHHLLRFSLQKFN